jgi:phospholipid transport system substrate-binding protein
MKIKVVLLSVVLSLFTVAAVAAPPGYPGWRHAAPQRAALADAGAMVRTGMEQLLDFLQQQPRPSALKLAAFLGDRITPYFDFEYMARAAVGPAYRRMSAEQRTSVVQKIEQDFLETLSKRLAGFEDQKVRYFPARRGRGHRTSVTVGIGNPGRYPARLDFRMYRGKDGWKVYDVAANGNSAVNYYRQKFSRVWGRSAPYRGRI